METTFALISILAVLAIGVISPGPSFILVARTAVAVSRRAAVSSALGMASGATVLAVAALLGLNALLSQVPMLYFAFKLFGGIYLLFLGFKIWREAATPIRIAEGAGPTPSSLPRHFRLAAVTMLSNPKAAVQYGVIFAAMLPQSPSLIFSVALPLAVFALEASWYLVVAFALSAPKPRKTYLEAKTSIDRAVGAVLGVIGIKLLLSSK